MLKDKINIINSFQYIFCFFLVFFIIISTISAQSGWEQLFYDDFGDGVADGWELKGLELNGYWEIYNDNGNYVLKGQGHNWANPDKKFLWDDYSLKCAIKMVDGGLFINYRVNERERYFVEFNAGSLVLYKHDWINPPVCLISSSENFLSDNWYDINITGIGNNIKVFVNNQLIINYSDPKPNKGGSIVFEANPNSVFYIDSIEVIGRPVPKPPTGYVWYRTGGPNGGTGYDIRIHPVEHKIMFVTDNPSGVNKSTDGGITWQQKNSGIKADPDRFGNGAPIFTLTVDPNNPNIIWSGTQNYKGIFKSTDNGETWQEKDNGITEGDEISFRGFAVNPDNSNIILAAAEINTGIWGYNYSISKGKIYKSVDGGENWYSVWEGNNLARVLIYDYKNPDMVYCSTGIFDREATNTNVPNKIQGGEGILKSTDGGEHWFNINNGLRNFYIGFLEMHPTNPQILYAAAGSPSLFGTPGDLYKTTNGGAFWQRIYSEHSYFSVVTMSPSNPDIVYAGNDYAFYRSTDGGISWQKYNNQPEDYSYGPPGISAGIPIGIVVDPDNPDIVFINSYQGGNFKSEDGGQTWINASKGYTGADMRGLAADINYPENVYSIGRTGPFKSTNGGNDWDGLSYGPATGPMDWFRLIKIPTSSSTLLLSDESQGRILKTTNDGNRWQVVYTHPGGLGSNPDNRHGFKALVYAPSNPDIIYGGMRKTVSGGHLEPFYGASFGIYKSTDCGETWSEKNSGLENSNKAINVIVVHPKDPNIVYAGTLFDGIYKTTNGGDNWFRISDGLGFTDVRSMAIDPEDPEIIYAGSGDGKGIAKSTNGGLNWLETNSGLKIVCPSYLSPAGRMTIGYDLTKPKSFFNTYYSSSFIPWTEIFDIVIDPKNHEKIYAADLNTGVCLSENGGNSWVLIDDGLSIKTVTCLAISSNGKVIYAGTSGGGVHRLVLGENNAPKITISAPSALDTVFISYGDSLIFNISAFDIDNDTLTYGWMLDGIEDINTIGTNYLLRTEKKQTGYHELTVYVSDNDTTVSVNWEIIIKAATGVGKDNLSAVPSEFQLYQNYPNPFNPITIIKFSIPKPAYITVKVFNILGEEIVTLVSEKMYPGTYTTEWNASQYPSGVYFYRIQAGEFMETRKLLLLK